MAGDLQAAAFTHGRDVFLSRNYYRAGTAEGARLVAHEMAHVGQGDHNGPAQIYRKAVWKQLDFMVMKRKNIMYLQKHFAPMLTPLAKMNKEVRAWTAKMKSADSYGHYWTEVGSKAAGDAQDTSGWKAKSMPDWTAHRSWGWWPAEGVDLLGTFKVPGFVMPGSLNQGYRNDPHHGEDPVDEVFHPALHVDEYKPDSDVAKDVMKKANAFATSFHGSWNWRFGFGKNCRTFQEKLMDDLGLERRVGESWTQTNGAVAMGGPKAVDWILSQLQVNGASGRGENAIAALDAGNAKLWLSKGIREGDWQTAARDPDSKKRILRNLGMNGAVTEMEKTLDLALGKAYLKSGPPEGYHLFHSQVSAQAKVSTSLVKSDAFGMGAGRTALEYANALPADLVLADYQALDDKERTSVLRRIGCTAGDLNAALAIKYGQQDVDIFT
jgi:hypothetical protein